MADILWSASTTVSHPHATINPNVLNHLSESRSFPSTCSRHAAMKQKKDTWSIVGFSGIFCRRSRFIKTQGGVVSIIAQIEMLTRLWSAMVCAVTAFTASCRNHGTSSDKKNKFLLCCRCLLRSIAEYWSTVYSDPLLTFCPPQHASRKPCYPPTKLRFVLHLSS